jgi:tetratricopeptide (TPR) repeat protein
MYRHWKDGKNPEIGVSSEVWGDVLKEMEGFRKAGHYAIANKMRGYGIDLLKVLVSLLELPNVPKKWLAEFVLLDEMDGAEPKDISRRRSAARGAIGQLQKDRVISETNGRLRFDGGPFDLLYLKYLWASKEASDIQRFFIGFSEDPIFNLYHKLTDNVFLGDFPEYYTQTRFDRITKVKGEKAEKFIIGAKAPNGPAGTHTLLEISPESKNEFYLGVPHSLRYRVNVEWMKEGFVTQVKFKKEKDKKRFQNHLKALADKLNVLGYTVLHEDEIAWHRNGVEFQKQGRAKEALECFNKAIEINPSFEPPWVDRVKIYLDAQKYDEALDHANKALGRHRHCGDALKLKGTALIHLGRNEEALDSLQRASKISPEDGSLWELRARAQSNLGRHKETIECAGESLKTNPTNHQLVSLKGLALFNLGRYEDALFCLNEALRLNPEYQTALLAKGQVLLSLGHYDDALTCLDAVLDKEWTNIDALISKGLALSKLSRYEEAIKCWDSIVQINRNNATGWYNKACFEARMDYTDAALESLYKAIQIDKNMALEAKREEDFRKLRNDERFIALTNLVWYANYGSNLCSRRFMRYIEGGQADGASGPHPGCRDKTAPKDDQPIKIPYPLYFAKQSPRWDNKGVAFIGLKKEETAATLGRMYLITEQQFLDVVSQENEGVRVSVDLQKAKQQGGMIFQEGGYGNILYLGEQDGFPIYTFTSSGDIGLEAPVAPSPRYLQYIISGLKEVYPLTNEDIVKYLLSKPGIKESYTRGELDSFSKEGGPSKSTEIR